MVVEAPAQDLPLLGIGVLELVDEDHLETVADPLARRRPPLLVGDDLVQPALQVVMKCATATSACGC